MRSSAPARLSRKTCPRAQRSWEILRDRLRNDLRLGSYRVGPKRERLSSRQYWPLVRQRSLLVRHPSEPDARIASVLHVRRPPRRCRDRRRALGPDGERSGCGGRAEVLAESGVATGLNAHIRAVVWLKSEQGFDATRMDCGVCRDDWRCATTGSASSANPCSGSCVYFSLAGALVDNTGHRPLRVVLD